MKVWVLVLGLFFSAWLPLSLEAQEHCPLCNAMMDEVEDEAEQEQGFSVLLGDETFVNSSYHFFRRLSREIGWRSRKVIRHAKRYPNAPVAQYWMKRTIDDQAFLKKREEKIRVLAFVGLGIYPAKDVLDHQNSAQFKKLQDRLFTSYIKYLDPDGEDVEKMEEDLMVDLKDFCAQSSDSFFSTTVSEFLGSASTRMEALLNAFPSFNQEDWLKEKSNFLSDSNRTFRRLALQFEALHNWFTKRLQNLIKEMFSPSRMEELLEDLLSNENEEEL